MNNIDSILSGLSEPKLKTYRSLGFVDDVSLVHGYINLQAASSHYVVPLQLLEVSLRNRLHEHISKRHGVDWYMNVPISQISKTQVIDAIKKAKKERNGNFGHDDVVCRLMFGFWVSMLDKPYRHNIWHYIKNDVFPGTTKSVASIFDELQALNKVRNRLFHHEPVWKNKNVHSLKDAIRRLESIYDRLFEALGWVSPEKQNILIQNGFKADFLAALGKIVTNP